MTDPVMNDEFEFLAEAAFTCKDCRVHTAEIGEYYMLHDAVWSATGLDPEGGKLCVGCVEERLGRRLQPADFMDCSANCEGFHSLRLSSRLGPREERRASLDRLDRQEELDVLDIVRRHGQELLDILSTRR